MDELQAIMRGRSRRIDRQQNPGQNKQVARPTSIQDFQEMGIPIKVE